MWEVDFKVKQMKWLKKCLGLEQIESDYLHIKKVYENNLRTQRELIDMVINFQSNICKEYIEVKDKLEKLEKELKELKGKE